MARRTFTLPLLRVGHASYMHRTTLPFAPTRDVFRKMSSFFRKVEHIINCHHTREYETATVNGDNDAPKLAVKQYIPHENPNPQPGDITIIGAHANGFPKELYEPLWDEVYERMTQKGLRIRSVWIADMWNQGQSGIINEKILGNDPSWSDHARDLISLIDQRQDDIPHPIVGIGHSMGGTQLSLLSLAHPRLLRSLVLIDPVIQVLNGSIAPAILSTPRRDIWPSREAAASRFRETKFFQSWDPRVLDQWIQYGLRDVPTELYPVHRPGPDKRVTLTTSKHQELFTFLRPTYRGVPGETFTDKDPSLDEEHPGYPFYRPEPFQVFQRLPELRPSVLYIFGKMSELSTPHGRREKMARTGAGVGGSGGSAAGKVKEVVLDCGHLVAMEKVVESADAIVTFLASEVKRWNEESCEMKKYRRAKPRRQQITVDEQWEKNVNPNLVEDSKL